ncbi:hypothetical protein BDF14DRAFT_1742828 [Spinellus fusiger]|nr:hypothetical protein BDF14DRAFT_1742828 [Spinellus fusiger]
MFKRAKKELAKQAIHTEDYNEEIALEEERLAGVFSGSEDESDDSDDELVIPAELSRPSYVKEEIDAEESDVSDEELSNNEDDSEDEDEEDEEEGDEEQSEGPVIYSCKICPNKHLKAEKQVEIHLQSKKAKEHRKEVKRKRWERDQAKKVVIEKMTGILVAAYYEN